MSKEDIHMILGLASVDQTFCKALLLDPCHAVCEKGFHLTQEECDLLNHAERDTIYTLSQYLMEHLILPSASKRSDTFKED
ncbi:hypothetical protein [Dictyobacter kobayashii]|uniref:Uncharacterized protein n=1 Tax=Dictyobacter kobayashii TaxID=2014872 RepID=A0A402ASM5_9CHLR|nr:hypothetical protein [Dictyobacter kobayashii]GCE22099.1 hypothetical protein KDK_58990 [Dictyobacter kobayashii]